MLDNKIINQEITLGGCQIVLLKDCQHKGWYIASGEG
jgi:hypothetical protein